jgi:hypothetical protein
MPEIGGDQILEQECAVEDARAVESGAGGVGLE